MQHKRLSWPIILKEAEFMILKQEYTQTELKELEKLYEKYYSFPSHVSGKQEVIDTLEAIKAIQDRAESKSLEYYKTCLDNLVIDIQDEFKLLMITISDNNPDFEFPTHWVSWAKDTLSPFLNLLDEKTKEQTKKKLDLLYKNKKSIIGSPEVVEIIETAKKSRREYQEILPKIINSHYAFMRQGTATNKLTKIKSDTKSVKLDQITGKATIQRGDFSEVLKIFQK